MLLVDRSAHIPTHPAGTPNPAATHAPGRPPDTFVLDDTMLKKHASERLKAVAPMRRVRFADVDDAEDTDSDDLEVFIAEMTRQSDAEAEALDRLTQGASSDSDESDTDSDVNPDVSDCERSGKVKVKIYAPFLSFCQTDTPLDDSASTPKNTRVRRRTDVVKENCNPRQWMAVSSADRGRKISELSDHCNGSRSPPKYPDWAAEIAEEREKLAAETLAEMLDKLAQSPPMNFDTEVRISRRSRDGSVLLPKSKRRKVVHVSTREA